MTIIFRAARQWSIEIIMDSCLPGEGNYVKVVGAKQSKNKKKHYALKPLRFRIGGLFNNSCHTPALREKPPDLISIHRIFLASWRRSAALASPRRRALEEADFVHLSENRSPVMSGGGGRIANGLVVLETSQPNNNKKNTQEPNGLGFGN